MFAPLGVGKRRAPYRKQGSEYLMFALLWVSKRRAPYRKQDSRGFPKCSPEGQFSHSGACQNYDIRVSVISISSMVRIILVMIVQLLPPWY
jgi:hypothetical protein